MPSPSTYKETKQSFRKSEKTVNWFCVGPHLQVKYYFFRWNFKFFLYLISFLFFFKFLFFFLAKQSITKLKNYWLWYSGLWKISKQFRSLVICLNLPWHHGAEKLGGNLFPYFVAFITNKSVSLYFRNTRDVLGCKHTRWRWSPWPTTSIIGGITIFFKTTDLANMFIPKITLGISSWSFNLIWILSLIF